jgi:K+-sensing histidine kinase KdpD
MLADSADLPGKQTTTLDLPPSAGGLSRQRRIIGLTACLVGLPLLTGLLVAVSDSVELDSVLLVYLLAVVLIAVIGGIGPSLLAALTSFLLANWFLTPPYHTFEVEGQARLIELVVFVVVAALVSVTVDIGARNRVRAERNQMEATLLSRLTSGDEAEGGVQGILEHVRRLFGMTSVTLSEGGPTGQPLASAGFPAPGPAIFAVPAGPNLTLTAHGPEIFAEDRRLLRTLAAAAGRTWEEQRLGKQAERARQLAETDQVRSALLAAVGHDLRTPLAAIKAAVSSLRQTDLTWTAADQDELLGGIEESTDRLTAVISNLLAMSRIQAGEVSVHLGPVPLDEAVAAALLSLGEGDERVHVPEDLPPVLADAGLLERVLANLIANTRRFSPPGRPGSITATPSGPTEIALTISDHGPGVPTERWDEMFEPFQTLGDRDPAPGLGMGLAIARGLTSPMGIELTPSQTHGGGLTMTLTLQVAR